MPVSRVPGKGVFPQLLDCYKPGRIALLSDRHRFTYESETSHDVGAWLICDRRTIRKCGLGHAKPAPLSLWPWTRSGSLKKGRTLADLASAGGIEVSGLQATVAKYNRGAGAARDPQFCRGETSFNRYLADPDLQPNPCVAPVGPRPYYAVRMEMSDLGTVDGLRTSVQGAVLDRQGAPVAGPLCPRQ